MDHAVFFGVDDRMSFREEQHAKAICYTCPVRLDCLLDAVDMGTRTGVWGGLTPNERSRLVAHHRGNLTELHQRLGR